MKTKKVPDNTESIPDLSPVLWEASEVETWETPPVEWYINTILPKGGIGFMSGPPKVRKSFLTLDMITAMLQRHPWLYRFSVTKNNPVPKVLYIAREDPAARVAKRLIEIQNSYKHGQLPKNHLKFLIRDRFNLFDAGWQSWLEEVVNKYGFDFLVLDVLNRMIPGSDELSAKDMANMIDVLELINRNLDMTILCLDHTRKPPIETNSYATPSPFDLKGSMAKYGCADFMICLSADKDDDNLIKVYSENKDCEDHLSFFVRVSAKDDPDEPKFKWEEATAKAELSSCSKALLKELTHVWESPSTILKRIPSYTEKSVRNAFLKLESKHSVERKGHTNLTRWRRKPSKHDEESSKLLQELDLDAEND